MTHAVARVQFEQLITRRKELHLAMGTNLREELFQRLDEAAVARRAAVAQLPPNTPLPLEVLPSANDSSENPAAARDNAPQALVAARARAAAAEQALEGFLVRLQAMQGDTEHIQIDADAHTVRFQGLCCVGAPALAASSGRIYYEVELLQVKRACDFVRCSAFSN